MQRLIYLTMIVCDNRLLTQNANTWLMEDLYRNPGPIQFDGPGSDLITLTLLVEEHDYIGKIQELCEYLDKVSDGISQLSLKSHNYAIVNWHKFNKLAHMATTECFELMGAWCR